MGIADGICIYHRAHRELNSEFRYNLYSSIYDYLLRIYTEMSAATYYIYYMESAVQHIIVKHKYVYIYGMLMYDVSNCVKRTMTRHILQ